MEANEKWISLWNAFKIFVEWIKICFEVREPKNIRIPRKRYCQQNWRVFKKSPHGPLTFLNVLGCRSTRSNRLAGRGGARELWRAGGPILRRFLTNWRTSMELKNKLYEMSTPLTKPSGRHCCWRLWGKFPNYRNRRSKLHNSMGNKFLLGLRIFYETIAYKTNHQKWNHLFAQPEISRTWKSHRKSLNFTPKV